MEVAALAGRHRRLTVCLLDDVSSAPRMTPTPTVGPASRRLLLLLVAGALVWFASLGIRPLFNPDEGRYADIPAEMLAQQDFVVPHLDGLAYLEKPPLQYWLTAVSLAAFGHNEWAARLVTGLAAAATVLLVGLLGRREWGREQGLYAAFMTASMLLFLVMGQLITLDMLLTAWLTLATVAFCLAQGQRDVDRRASRRWMLICWAAMGAATLTKGLIGVVLPGAVLVLYTVLHRDWAVWRHLSIGAGLTLYLALVLPWFVLVERAHPGALNFLIIHEHFQRYLTTVHARYHPWWYFLMILAAGSLPWLPQVARALFTGWRATVPAGGFDTRRLLWVSAAFTLVFFSLSDSKLPPYIVPMLPPLALLAAGNRSARGRDLGRAALLQALCAIVLSVALVLYGHKALSGDPAWTRTQLTPWLVAVIAVLMTGGVIGWFGRQRLETGAIAVGLSGFVATLLLIVGGANAIAGRYSVRPLLERGGPLVAEAPLYTVNTFDWTLPFYTGRVVIPVSYRGELDYGLASAPSRAIATVAEFETVWRELPMGYALIPHETARQLIADGVPMRMLAEDFDNIWVSRR